MTTYLKWIIYIFVSLCIFIFGIWHIVISTEIIEKTIAKSIKTNKYDIKIVGLKKGLFYNLRIESITLERKIKDGSKVLITFNNTHIYPSLSSILRFQPLVRFRATSGQGEITGLFDIMDVKEKTEISVKGLLISETNILKDYDVTGDGQLDMEMSIRGGEGSWQLSIENCRFDKWTMDNVPIPLDMFRVIRGVGSITHGSIEIKSLTLNGRGIQALLKGRIDSKPELTMEILAERDFEYLSLLDISLNRFKRSAGFFVIPINLKDLTTN